MWTDFQETCEASAPEVDKRELGELVRDRPGGTGSTTRLYLAAVEGMHWAEEEYDDSDRGARPREVEPRTPVSSLARTLDSAMASSIAPRSKR